MIDDVPTGLLEQTLAMLDHADTLEGDAADRQRQLAADTYRRARRTVDALLVLANDVRITIEASTATAKETPDR